MATVKKKPSTPDKIVSGRLYLNLKDGTGFIKRGRRWYNPFSGQRTTPPKEGEVVAVVPRKWGDAPKDKDGIFGSGFYMDDALRSYIKTSEGWVRQDTVYTDAGLEVRWDACDPPQGVIRVFPLLSPAKHEREVL